MEFDKCFSLSAAQNSIVMLSGDMVRKCLQIATMPLKLTKDSETTPFGAGKVIISSKLNLLLENSYLAVSFNSELYIFSGKRPKFELHYLE